MFNFSLELCRLIDDIADDNGDDNDNISIQCVINNDDKSWCWRWQLQYLDDNDDNLDVDDDADNISV